MKLKILYYVKEWEQRCYFEGIPDEVPTRLYQLKKAPSYKAIAVAILTNDHCLKSLGQQPPKSVYYDVLKKIELKERGVIKQLSLF